MVKSTFTSYFEKEIIMELTITENDPLLDATFQVSPQDIKDYAKNGFVKINNICTVDEIEPYRQELKLIVDEFRKNKKPLSDRDLYGKAFLQIGNIWLKSQRIKAFTLAKRFGKIAADLMAVDAVRLYHDQALYKEEGGGHTPWHQDQFYWPTEDSHTITMWMPLVDATFNMGLMEFVVGAHKNGMLANIEISASSDKFFSDMIEKGLCEITTYDSLAAGSATFHSGWTPHRAGPNNTKVLREVMTIIYIADGIKVSIPKSKSQESDLQTCFPGLKPGDLAASPINPLIYQRKSKTI